MSAKRTVSLLVPCFNAEYYLADFIKNMSQQIKPFDEVLFYDDASTDGTAELLRQQNFGVETSQGDSEICCLYSVEA